MPQATWYARLADDSVHTSPMRIGITGYPTYGGSGVVATELGQELAARGHEVHFITSAPPIRMNPNDPRIHFHQAEVVSYPLFDHSPYTLSLAVKMLEVFEKEALDILHVHYAIPHSVSALLARQMASPRRLPFITTLHGTDITLVGNNPNFLPITRYSIEQSDGVTSISNYLLRQTVAEFGIKRPIEVIPNFVNCDLYVRKPSKKTCCFWASRTGLRKSWGRRICFCFLRSSSPLVSPLWRRWRAKCR